MLSEELEINAMITKSEALERNVKALCSRDQSPWQRSLARAFLERLSHTHLSNTRVGNGLLPQVLLL